VDLSRWQLQERWVSPSFDLIIFDILANYWDVQLKDPEALYRRLAKFQPTREGFKVVKDVLKLHWNKRKKLRRLDLAAHYFFNSNTSYGPHFLGWPSSVYLQKVRYSKMKGMGEAEQSR
jgi:DNA adenine methylase